MHAVIDFDLDRQYLPARLNPVNSLILKWLGAGGLIGSLTGGLGGPC